MKIPYSRYFPTPSFLMMNSCAIDISDSSIKYGEIKATTHGLVLNKYGQIKIPSGIVVSGKIEKEKDLIAILDNLRIKEGLKFVRISLPEEQMYLFTTSIPKNDNFNPREVISLQIEEHIPLKAIDTTFDYNIISEGEKNFLVEVSAIATTTVESYLRVLNEASLTPLSFELEAQPIARSVISDDDKEPVMIVDFGNTRTGVSVAYNGRIFMTTTLDLGGANLTNMIAKNFSISFEEAEKMKKTYGISGSSNIGDIFPIILNGISVLRDEINKQTIYWNKHLDLHLDNKEIKRIILCGGDSNISGLASYLETTTGMKVENADVWVNLSDMKNYIPDISFEESLGYATVIGLTLNDFSYDRFILNVLPQDVKKNNRKNYWKRFVIMFFNVLAVSFSIATLLLFPSFFFSKQKEILAENRLESFNLANPELENNNIDEIIKDINSKLDKLSKHKNSDIVNDVVFEILRNKPSSVSFEQILFNKRNDGVSIIEIHGISPNRDSLRLIKANFEKSSVFENINLPVSSFIESEDINFNISMNLK